MYPTHYKLGLAATLLAFASSITAFAGGAPVDKGASAPTADFFWRSSVQKEETVLLVNKGGVISGRLLFTPTEIIKIQDYFTEREWKPEDSVTVHGADLIVKQGASLPFMNEDALYPPKAGTDSAGNPVTAGTGTLRPAPAVAWLTTSGRPIVAADGNSFVKHQIRVTYRHRPAEWTERGGPEPSSQIARLPRVMRLLTARQPLKIVVFGDSISAGANASGVPIKKNANENWPGTPYAPFQKAYPGRLADKLHERFGSEVTLVNLSVGGMATPSALKCVDRGKRGQATFLD